MLDHCDKHGPYSAFCRECDLETIEEAMKPTPTTAMIEAGQKALEEAPIEWGQEAETVWSAMEAVRQQEAAPHPTKPQPAYAPDHPKNLEDGTPCQYVSRAQPADITAKVERARTSLAHIECFYVENDDDRKRVRSILDAFEALSSQSAEGIEEGDEGSMYDLGRADALETAAKVAERQFTDAGWNGHYYNAGVVIARAIRALTQDAG